MAYIRFVESNERIEDPAQVAEYLATQGIVYENWDISKLQGDLQTDYKVTPELQAAILGVFKPEIDALSEKHGYLSSDIVVLSDQTPNLEDLLVKLSSTPISHSRVQRAHAMIVGRLVRYFSL